MLVEADWVQTVFDISAFQNVCDGITELRQADARLEDHPALELLPPPRPGERFRPVIFPEGWDGIIHVFRLFGMMARHPLTRRIDAAREHLAEPFLIGYDSSRGWQGFEDAAFRAVWAERVLSSFYEAFVFLMIAKAGFEVEFIETTSQRSPDLILPKLGLLIECKDIQGRALEDWETPKLAARVRDNMGEAFTQMLKHDPDEEFEHICFVDLPDSPHRTSRALPGQRRLELIANAFDFGEGGLDLSYAKRCLLSRTGLYHLVNREPRGPQPIVVPEWLEPLAPVLSKKFSVLVDALFREDGTHPIRAWRPLHVMRAAFDHELPAEYRQARDAGRGKEFIETYY